MISDDPVFQLGFAVGELSREPSQARIVQLERSIALLQAAQAKMFADLVFGAELAAATKVDGGKT